MPKTFNLTDFIATMEECLGTQDGPAKPFWKALSFAVDAHQGQRRKSGEQYISHPCHVVQILAQEFGVTDPETLAAAILHDTIEDVPEVTQEVIGEHFGRNIEAIVDGCTKVENRSGDRQAFSKQVHRKIFSGAASRIEVMLIKMADRLHNMRTMDSMPKHKRQKIAEETLNIYAPMARIMGIFELKRELYNLALTYKFPRQSHKLKAKIDKLVSAPEVVAIRKRIEEELEQCWLTNRIYVVPKGLWAYFDPENQVLVKEIDTPLEIIIVVPDIQSCYRTLGVVNQVYPPIPSSIRDFIANPKPTGYQSLHARTNIDGQNYLFKFRTDQMYRVGRVGLIRMWLDHRQEPSAYEEEVKEIFNILGGDDDLSYTDAIAASGGREIYTFTPKGERICLPKQSTVLDFAFKVHTEIGSHCVGAIVGSRRTGIKHILQDGDRVQIITRKSASEFEPEMLDLCQTAKARSSLAKIFRHHRQILARDIGFSIIRQEMKRYGLPREILEDDHATTLLDHFEFGSMEELYQQLGSGQVLLKSVIMFIKDTLYAGHPTHEPPTGALNQIFLNTLDPACIKLSRCCSPIPTEKGLYGLLSQRGLSVHRKECAKMRSLNLQREDVVELKWKLKETVVSKPQTIVMLKVANRNRLLMMLGVAPLEMKIQELILLAPLANGDSVWQINFEVETLQALKNVLNHFDKTGLEYEIALEQ
jgi:guanosine-3',5'-bis(diphosphate) 3'-pyrophosphohydrolase